MGFQLDALDYKILKMLSENARRPYLEIARECGVSGAAIHQRVQKLYGMECYECGSCTYACPAKLPLTQSFKAARKALIEQRKKSQQVKKA